MLQPAPGVRRARIPWTAQRSWKAFGVRIGLRSNCEAALDLAAEFLPPLYHPCPARDVQRIYSLVAAYEQSPPDRAHQLFADARLLACASSWQPLLDRLETELQIHIGEMAPDRVFVHAGVVSLHGIGLVIPGRSFSGKSTLVAALLRAGATYYSDEFAVLDAEGNVHPYPRRLSLRLPGRDRPLRCSPEDLGAQRGIGPIRPQLFLLTRHRPGRAWSPRSVPLGPAILELARHSLAIRRNPAAVLNALTNALSRAVVVRTERGEADETVRHLSSLFDSLPALQDACRA